MIKVVILIKVTIKHVKRVFIIALTLINYFIQFKKVTKYDDSDSESNNIICLSM